LDKEYAQGYAESFLNAFVATQIKVIREQRNMTQAGLAAAIGTTQTGISRIENVNYSSWSIRTLIKLARAFDVRLKVSFEPFGTLPDEVIRFDRRFLERVKRVYDPGLSEMRETREWGKVLDIGELKQSQAELKALAGSNQGDYDNHPNQKREDTTGEQGYAATCSANG
jgi:transcriptional regulator with XRE-family HTH domain